MRWREALAAAPDLRDTPAADAASRKVSPASYRSAPGAQARSGGTGGDAGIRNSRGGFGDDRAETSGEWAGSRARFAVCRRGGDFDFSRPGKLTPS
jgi:hypothetical protein